VDTPVVKIEAKITPIETKIEVKEEIKYEREPEVSHQTETYTYQTSITEKKKECTKF